MNKVAVKTQLALAVVAALGIAACNESGDDNNLAGSSITPISKTTSGVITGFGSVFINGVEYDTQNTTFIIDGEEGDESSLKLGMVVTLSGTDDNDGTGNAVNIEFEDEVEGLVLANNILLDGTMNVMGLTINTNEDTVFESNDISILGLEEIIEGNIVEVSGYSSGDGSVWATRVELKKTVFNDGQEIEVKGVISNVTTTNFVLGDMLVDYSTAVLDEELSEGLLDGMLVKVESNLGLDANGTLIASEIELKNATGKKEHQYDEDDEKLEIEGLITAVISGSEIEINGAPVVLDANTFYIHGDNLTAAVGLKVKAVGVITAEGKLLAEKLVYKPTGDIKLTGLISAVDVLSSSIVMFGQTILLDNYTMVKDEKDDDESNRVKYNFGVDDLGVGDQLKIKAYENGFGSLTAIKMKRMPEESDNESKLVGFIDEINIPSQTLVVSGITVDFSVIPNFSAYLGDKIELKGVYTDGVFIPNAEISVEEDSEEHYISGKEGHEDDERPDESSELESDDDSDSSHDDSHDSEEEHDDDGTESNGISDDGPETDGS